MTEITHSEIGEKHPIIVDLQKERRGQELGNIIQIPSDILGTSKWDTLLRKTRETEREYGIITSVLGKRIFTSEIFDGYPERPNYNNGKKLPATIIPPSLPHGLRSLDPRMRDCVLIHSHPITEAVQHLETTLFSATDIQTYLNTNYTALIMLDKGGVHLLTGKNPFRSEEVDADKLIEDAFTHAPDYTSAGVRTEMAKLLQTHGIRYYFTKEKTPSPDGFLEFKDATLPL